MKKILVIVTTVLIIMAVSSCASPDGMMKDDMMEDGMMEENMEK